MSVLQTYMLYICVFFITVMMLSLVRYSLKVRLHAGPLNISNINTSMLILVSLMPLVLLATFRYGIGTDYFSFEETYDWCMNKLDSFSQLQKAVSGFNDEPGLYLLMKLGGVLFGSYRGFLFLGSVLTVFPAFVAYLLYDKKHFIFCFSIYLITLYLSSYNGIHQHISVSWCLLAAVMAYKGKYVKSILIIMFAMLFHTTAIFTMVFLILIIWSKRNTEFKLYVVVLLSMITIVGIQLLLSVMSKIPMLARYAYAFSEHYEFSVNFLIMHLAFKIPLVAIMLFRKNKLLNNDRKNLALLSYALLDIVFVFSAFYMRWTMRMQYYTLSTAPFLMANIFKTYKGRTERENLMYIKPTLVSVYIIRFIVLFGVYGYDAVFPYTFLG